MKQPNLLSTNSKLKKDGIHSFGLPAIKTCPFAGACKAYCYATHGCYRYPVVKHARERNLKATREVGFSNRICAEISRRDIKRVRIHDSGDFYSRPYLAKWLDIAHRNPWTQFYCYTKSIPYFVEHPPTYIPLNFRVIFSTGGKRSDLIDTEKHRHASVFKNSSRLNDFGYDDGSQSDLVAATTKSLKIGLILH